MKLYGDGADIVYYIPPNWAQPVLESAREFSGRRGSGDGALDPETKVWAIGTDFDHFGNAGPVLAPHVLTSMIKRADVAVYNTALAVDEATFLPEPTTLDLAVDGVGYSTSGGFIEDIVTDLEKLKAQIIKGEIVVPRVGE